MFGEAAFIPAPGELQPPPSPAPKDTVKMRYPVTKPTIESYEDLNQTHPVDLENPENIKTVIEYDPASGNYIMRTKVGDMEVGTPFMLTPDEYQEYSLRESMRDYWRSRDEESSPDASKKRKTPFSITDMSFELGPLDKLFGPGGVQVKTQGFAEISFGFQHRNLDNPTAAQKNRSRTNFKFDEVVQMNVNATVGDKLNFGMNYNTDATFDFDQQQIKLKYDGKEDEIIKHLEAGNVSMTTTNSLVKGGAALFGIKADLQFGKLKVSALASQQQSQSQSVKMDRGAQMTPYEINVTDYDENRHFFLSQFFYANYDSWIKKLPKIESGMQIKRIEVWVTNKRSNFDQPRNIVAFADLAEHDSISNSIWSPSIGFGSQPVNESNDLYAAMVNNAGLRDISQVTQIFTSVYPDQMVSGRDYEKIENARKLTESEYTINNQLGYISLNAALQPDEVLAVAYEYTYAGKVYQVGEFSSDNIAPQNALFLKLVKNTNLSPSFPTWKLMMKNIYSLGAYQIQKDRFAMNIMYQSDTAGVYLNYIPETVDGKKNTLWLRLAGLDRLDTQQNPNPDGFFDYVEGFTVISQNGRIIFPSTQPFGKGLRNAINNDAIADKYVFPELYDSTMTIAKQIAERNKFKLQGEYKGSSSNVIQLNGTNIPRGSVRVTAGGVTLTEGTDYTVNYVMGEVTIINQSILGSGTPINATYESQSLFNQQRKTLLGLNLSYDFSEDFSIGGTIMNLSEKPLTTKVTMGDESVNNTLWGLNMSYRTKSQTLTNWIDKLPFVEATQPSQITFNAEFAQLLPGHAGGIDYSYIDDFESTQTGWSLMSPYEWSLASTPSLRFGKDYLSDSIQYGKNRALLAWYTIDQMFTNRNSSITPSHIKNDLNQLSNHYVREVFQSELFPDRQTLYNEATTIPVFNLAYYPKERGPYNLDATSVDPQSGFLLYPETRWGGIMRKILSAYTDFEKNNFEYIEFWLMDPFIYKPDSKGGYLFFDLGDISEDVLKDGKKFYENGITADTATLDKSIWGYVPKRQALVYAFDAQADIKIQDVGLNGLSAEEEKTYPVYAQYLQNLRQRLSPAVVAQMEQDPFSPFNSPSGDLYHHYRGADYDLDQKNILERYKWYNGTEGNSVNLNDNSLGWSTAARTAPDFEDINEDMTLSESERFYEYRVGISPDSLVVGKNYVVDKRDATVRLRNGQEATVSWYQFKIPVQQNNAGQQGTINDFKSIRFMRMFMTQFTDTTILRFGTFEFVRGEWRKYEQDLNNPNLKPSTTASLSVSSVNIEENGSRSPVNYILPPGVSRILDPSQPQLRQNNEQALSLRLENLSAGDARAVYRNTGFDMRQYKRLQMFAHAEKFINETTQPLTDGQVAVFIRMGSDYKSNYYEYEVPLNLTPPRIDYNSDIPSDRLAVWPNENMVDIFFEKFTDLKLERNTEKRKAGSKVTFYTPYYKYDSDNPRNKITVMGNPSLSEIKTIMIGVRNNSNSAKSVEVWVNELRLTDFNESGGWAAKGNLNVMLSDLGSVNLGGQIETTGFGGIEESVSERRLDDYHMYNIAASLNLGRFLPKQAKISAPFYYSYSEQVNSPKYNPLDGDILLKDALDAAADKTEKDSIKAFAQQKVTNSSFSLSGVKVDIKSKNPMPYDPSNFSFGYSQNINRRQDPTTAWETTKDYRLNMTYAYSSAVKPLEPFAKSKNKSPFFKPIQAMNFNYVPNSFGFVSDITRNYYEIQLRDMSNPGGSYENVPIAFREEFYWNRGFNIRWNLSRSLQFSFDNTTRAKIETPNVVVNKELYPDEYREWKDAVWQSIRDMGTPLSYAQTFDASYSLPFGVIPILDWISSTAKYNARYTWDKGAYIDDETIMGNTIANEMTYQLDGNFNLEGLYNKSSFLKEVNRKFNSSSSQQRTTNKNQPPKRPPVKKKFDTQVQLLKDSAVVVTHNLNTKNIRVKAYRQDNTVYSLKYKRLDNKTIRIQNHDSISLKVNIVEGPDPGESSWYRTAQYAARGLMMIRRFSLSYKETNSTQIPGFLPDIGDWTGQGNSNGSAPGWKFAFGLVDGYDYIHDAYGRGWLSTDSTNINPAVTNVNKDFSATALIEPVRGLKIDLNARWNDSKYTQVQYMYDGMPESKGGNFTMTTIALKSAFRMPKREEGFETKAFRQFLVNRDIIADRLQAIYNSGIAYPTGFPGYSGNPYSEATGKIDRNSPEVLIPAFLSAYATGDPNTIKLTAFPSLASMLPNWRISYDGLSQIGWIKDRLKSVVLNHAYRCTYSVGSYQTYQSWIGIEEGNELGFVPDVQTKSPVPSFQYDIASVSITESFAPLLGITVTFKNNVSCTGEYRNTRTLNLNMSANQLIEALKNEIVLGIGYKIINFNNVLKMRDSKAVNHDLNVRGDISYSRIESIIHKVEENYSEAVSGTESFLIKISADYNFSKALTIRAFFDRQMNKPLVSSTSYPITTTNFGFAMRFALSR
ncbi:MAG: cell surface protein SprA [Candidatus Azobacteroides sp.]|nr:cell surface protein SprA [Candidatus Azobacteroides sp.]